MVCSQTTLFIALIINQKTVMRNNDIYWQMSLYSVNGHTQNWEGFAMQTTAVTISRKIVDLNRSVGPGLVIFRLKITFSLLYTFQYCIQSKRIDVEWYILIATL